MFTKAKKKISNFAETFLGKRIQKAVNCTINKVDTVHVVQIGANDGMRLDFVRTILLNYPHKALLAEPVPTVFEKLQTNYADFNQVRCLQVAVAERGEKDFLPFYTLQPKPGQPFNPDFTFWGSFDEHHLEKFRNGVPGFEDMKKILQVRVMEMNDFLKTAAFHRIDLLQIDAEGWDIKLVNAINLQQWQPGLIRFEHIHAPKSEVFALLKKLKTFGYKTFSHGMDTLAVHPRVQKHFLFLQMAFAVRPQWLLPAR